MISRIIVMSACLGLALTAPATAESAAGGAPGADRPGCIPGGILWDTPFCAWKRSLLDKFGGGGTSDGGTGDTGDPGGTGDTGGTSGTSGTGDDQAIPGGTSTIVIRGDILAGTVITVTKGLNAGGTIVIEGIGEVSVPDGIKPGGTITFGSDGTITIASGGKTIVLKVRTKPGTITVEGGTATITIEGNLPAGTVITVTKGLPSGGVIVIGGVGRVTVPGGIKPGGTITINKDGTVTVRSGRHAVILIIKARPGGDELPPCAEPGAGPYAGRVAC